MLRFAILFIGAYFLGAVNFPILLFRLRGRRDPRDGCSGNAGVTNVYRQAGPIWAAVVLLLEIGRGAGLALLAMDVLPLLQVPWVAFGLILGNHYPCYHGFRGGKGVASYLGFTVAVAPVFATIAALGWLSAFYLWRIPFLASFVMIIVLAAGNAYGLNHHILSYSGIAVTILFILYAHRSNIVRWRST